ncbi:hypothetical protein EVAR_52483_1 [Eumeta japonica]|uniref:Uncharacterized protein n=1 Tax=Eumeta variegata TaxID=151549 RepID=A0A4C1Z357_EUMVA|nr:hypothetical protein EVAR_52483_1 [Eumeta japonica]
MNNKRVSQQTRLASHNGILIPTLNNRRELRIRNPGPMTVKSYCKTRNRRACMKRMMQQERLFDCGFALTKTPTCRRQRRTARPYTARSVVYSSFLMSYETTGTEGQRNRNGCASSFFGEAK